MEARSGQWHSNLRRIPSHHHEPKLFGFSLACPCSRRERSSLERPGRSYSPRRKAAPRVTETVFELVGGGEMLYAISLPAGYDGAFDDPRPLILALLLAERGHQVQMIRLAGASHT